MSQLFNKCLGFALKICFKKFTYLNFSNTAVNIKKVSHITIIKNILAISNNRKLSANNFLSIPKHA